jgi:hypothetical protein
LKKARYRLSLSAEPGSWVMFIAAFAAGSAKAAGFGVVNLAVFFSLGLMLLAKPSASRVYKKNYGENLFTLVVLFVPAAAGLVYSAFLQPPLVPLYIAGALLFLLHIASFSRGRLVLSEAFGMALMGLSAYIAASMGGGIGSGIYLWPMFFVFYLASSFRVRLGIKRYRLVAILFNGAVLASSLFLAALGNLLFLAFLPPQGRRRRSSRPWGS